jgi:hypothetical protein
LLRRATVTKAAPGSAPDCGAAAASELNAEQIGAFASFISSLPSIFFCCNEFLSVTFPGTADMPFDRTNKLRVESMLGVLSFAVESSEQIQELLKKAKGSLSTLFSLMFPKIDQNRTLGELANTFFVDSNSAI